MSEKQNLQPLGGMAEWSPAEQLVFERWKQTVREAYALYGYTPLETPVLERAEIIAAKAGGNTEKQIYWLEKGNTKMAMRFDLTVPLARYVAERQSELAFPFRRQAIDRSYRGERQQKGRYREFYQADVDIVGRGSLSLEADAEILCVAAEAIRRLNLGEFQLQINNRKVLVGFLQGMKVMDEIAVLQLLDDAEKIGPKKLEEELKLLRLDTFEVRKIKKFAAIKGGWHEVAQELLRLDIDNKLFNEGMEELDQLNKYLEARRLDSKEYQYNMAIVRGLDYYTGTIFETTLMDNPKVGSVGSGGRYDDLVGNFAKTKMPGVGFSIGLTRLFSQVLEAGMLELQQQTVARAAILPLTDQLDMVHDIAECLRQAGIPVSVYLEGGGVKKAMKFANSLGVPYAVIIGDDEIAANRVTVRNMQTGEQEQLNLAQVIDTLSGN